MWIIPSNHPLYSAYVPENVDSKEVLNELSDQLEQSLMWKSKPLSLKTWSGKLNRVYWLTHLFSRILKPSLGDSFAIRYSSSLEDIPASLSVLQESSEEQKTLDTSSHSSRKVSKQLDLYAVSSKTSQGTLISDTEKSNKAWKDLVTQLSKEYSQRKKLARLTRENASIYSQSEKISWATPDSSARGARALDLINENGNQAVRRGSGQVRGIDLQTQVMVWCSPTASDGTMSKKDQSKLVQAKSGTWRYQAENGQQSNAGLSNQVLMDGKVLARPTPNTMDTLPPKSEKALKHEMEEVRPGRRMVSNLRDAVYWKVESARPTPTTAEAGKISNTPNYGQKGLSSHPAIVGETNRPKKMKSRAWGTPRVTTNQGLPQKDTTKDQSRLEDQVMNWGTPTTRDWKDGTAESVKNVPVNGLLGRMVHATYGPQDLEKNKKNGSRLVLNPAWVSHLMGIHLEKIFFGYSEMVWWNRQRNLLSQHCYENSTKEFWVDVKGYEGLYQISVLGRIKSLKRIAKRRDNTTREVPEIILTPIKNDKGYMVVTLSKDGCKKRFRRSRLVAENLCLNPNGYNEVNHIDGDKENDSAYNLEWCTRSQNVKHAYSIGLR